MWVRLILENSTVCLISRRISLFCPVGVMFGCLPFLGGWLIVVSVVSLAMILTMFLSVLFFVMDVALIDCRLALLVCGWGWVFFSMESLILAQDERWRRA